MAIMKNSWRQRGTELVEAAIILPLVMLLLLGVIEYGWLFTRVGELNNAARHAARVGIRVDATQSDILAAVDELLGTEGANISGAAVDISADPSTLETGQTLRVTITAAYRGNLELIGTSLFPVPDSIKASAAMAKEGT